MKNTKVSVVGILAGIAIVAMGGYPLWQLPGRLRLLSIVVLPLLAISCAVFALLIPPSRRRNKGK